MYILNEPQQESEGEGSDDDKSFGFKPLKDRKGKRGVQVTPTATASASRPAQVFAVLLDVTIQFAFVVLIELPFFV